MQKKIGARVTSHLPVEIQPPLKSIAMDVKELPGWIPGERVKTLHVVCEGSSMHAVIPFGHNDTETSQTLQRPLVDAWLRPHVRLCGTLLEKRRRNKAK